MAKLPDVMSETG